MIGPSSPYTVRYGVKLEQETPTYHDLNVAILVCRGLRNSRDWRGNNMEPQVHGDNYDVDNADGLTKDERDRVWEGVEDGLDEHGAPYAEGL